MTSIIEQELEALQDYLSELKMTLNVFGDKHTHTSSSSFWWDDETKKLLNSEGDDKIMGRIRACKIIASTISYNLTQINHVIEFKPLPAIPAVKFDLFMKEIKKIAVAKNAAIYDAISQLSMIREREAGEEYWLNKLEVLMKQEPKKDMENDAGSN